MSFHRDRHHHAIARIKSQRSIRTGACDDGAFHEAPTGEGSTRAAYNSCSFLILVFFPSDVMVTQVVNNAIKAKSGSHNSVAFGDRQPALGPSFAFLTDSTLWLSRCDLSGGDGDGCTFKAEVLRSRKTVGFILHLRYESDGLPAVQGSGYIQTAQWHRVRGRPTKFMSLNANRLCPYS